MNQSNKLVLLSVASMLLLGASVGCQSMKQMPKWPESFNLAKNIPWTTGSNKRENPPEKVVGFWTEAVHRKGGETPQRGFGGRIFFYDKKGGEPIQVDGQLVVYAFDEANRLQTDNRPSRRFVFPAEQMAKQYSECELGHSYSVWLPWDDAGGEKRKISLIARFEPAVGPVVVSSQTEHNLPGTEPTQVARNAPSSAIGYPHANQQAAYLMPQGAVSGSPNSVNQSGFSSAVPGNNAQQSFVPNARMTTTSIALPNSVGRNIPTAAVLNAPTGPIDVAALQAVGRTKPFAQFRQPTNQAMPQATTTAQTSSTYPSTKAPTAWPSQLGGFQHARRLVPTGQASPPANFRQPTQPHQ